MKHANTVHLQLGKNGITDSVLKDIKEKLQTTNPLVIKMNQSFRQNNDRKLAAQEIATKTKSKIDSLTGGVLIISRKQ